VSRRYAEQIGRDDRFVTFVGSFPQVVGADFFGMTTRALITGRCIEVVFAVFRAKF